jgi:hypothetical protein
MIERSTKRIMGESPSPRKLNVDLDELTHIFDSNEPSLSYYLDLEDGQIIQVTEETRLEHAIQNRGAFRNFKDGLAAYTAERERWFAFKDAQLQARALEWLHDEGIELAEP